MDEHQTEKSPQAISRILGVLERLFIRRAQRPDLPYMPHPNQTTWSPPAPGPSDQRETETELHQILGLTIPFGTQKTIQVTESGDKNYDTSFTPHYVVGTHRMISRIEDVGGICTYCHLQAMEAYRKGLITLEQQQVQSLFDVDSSVRCDDCGKFYCVTHCLRVEVPERTTMLCVDCAKQFQRKLRRRRIVSFLLEPFIATKE
jgi:hypothetical protein